MTPSPQRHNLLADCIRLAERYDLIEHRESEASERVGTALHHLTERATASKAYAGLRQGRR